MSMKTPSFWSLLARLVLAGLVLYELGGCATNTNHRPPPSARPPMVVRPIQPAPRNASMDADSIRASHYAEAARLGVYTVRPGDTLIRIGLETGQNWRDIQRWNNLERPNLIEVGQVLRLTPPPEGSVRSAVRAEPLRQPAATPPAPVSTPSSAGASNPPSGIVSTPLPPIGSASAETPAPSAPTAASQSGRDAGENDLIWIWPAAGPLVSSFDEARNKGVSIAGKAGDPVNAAADGRVVYAGSGLRGYGNLIIIKHNDTYLTAYAHNQSLLVKEDQPVKRGQKIAEMGSSDTDRVQLHFEVRRKGKPIDPTRILPMR
jgi:lipoprotein NlpD